MSSKVDSLQRGLDAGRKPFPLYRCRQRIGDALWYSVNGCIGVAKCPKAKEQGRGAAVKNR